MDWAVVAGLMLQYGIPLAEKVVQKWESGAVPTSADFVELRALGQQQAQDRMKAVLALHGIPLDSEQAKALLALAK